MLGPTIAQAGRSKQTVDDLFKCAIGSIVGKGFDFLRRRRPTREVERHSTKPCVALGVASRAKPVCPSLARMTASISSLDHFASFSVGTKGFVTG